MSRESKKRKSEDDCWQKLKQLKLTLPGEISEEIELVDSEDKSPQDHVVEAREKYPGYIEKLRLRNFMCHSSFEINFHEKINFIVGRNGSGKSAILTAIILGLGGKATSTNRASAVKDLVKKGSASCSIEITLANTGYRAYNPEKYGDKIIVSRTINCSGLSTYRIKNASGEIVGTKRDDVDYVVNGLGIQVDNPGAVLTQEAARTFFIDHNPYTLYLVYKKGTRMDEIMNAYKEMKSLHKLSYDFYNSRKEVMTRNSRELTELRERLSTLESLQKKKNQIVSLENELYWAHARRERMKLEYFQKQLEDQMTDIAKKKDNIMALLQKEASLKETLSDIKRQMKDFQDEIKKLAGRIKDAETTHQADRHQYSSKMAALKDCRRRIANKNEDIDTLMQGLERNRSDGMDWETERTIQLERIEAIDEEINRITSTMNTTGIDSTNLKATVDRYERELAEYKEKFMKIRRKIDDRDTRIRQLTNEPHSMYAFGSQVPQLIREINKAFDAGKFNLKPIGPIGAYIRVRDGNWSATVESLLGTALLFTFCCNDRDDATVFKKLSRVIPEPRCRPGCITSKFLKQVYNVSPNLVRHPNYPALFDILEISHPAVANALIDRIEIESILLIPTNQEACVVMSDKRKVPKNCKRALTLNGDTYYPDPDYRTYAGNGNKRTKLLQISTEQTQRDLQEDKDRLMAEANKIQQEICEHQRKIVNDKRMLKETIDRIEILSKKKCQLNRSKNSILDTLPPEPTNVETLGSELKAARSDLKNLTNQLNVLEAEEEKLKAIALASKKRLNDLQTEMQELKRKFLDLQGEDRNQEEAIKENRNDIQLQQNDLYRDEEKRKHIQASINQQEGRTQEAVRKARDICPEVETRRSPEEIREQRDRLKEQVNGVENERGTLDAVAHEYYTKKESFDTTWEKMKRFQDCIETVREAIALRRKSYLLIMGLMSLRIKSTFSTVVCQRYGVVWVGKMKFDHKNSLLGIKSRPENKTTNKEESDAKTLSGGERSYSTVAFILSLWEAIDPPFFMMDEFDVFMDKVNRGIVIELLLNHARRHPHFQFMFFTPQDTSSVEAAEDLKIHQMDDAQ